MKPWPEKNAMPLQLIFDTGLMDSAWHAIPSGEWGGLCHPTAR